jgi:16S rRNA (cytosine1402-N4)-methyltransferase
MGGHSALILEAYTGARLIGLDSDSDSLSVARQNLARFGERCLLLQCDFEDLFEKHPELPFDEISGVVVDPGLSTWQLKESDRGFSHSRNQKLDMRKNKSAPLNAAEIVNGHSYDKLREIFLAFGELRPAMADRLTQAIIEHRLREPLETTLQLRLIVEKIWGWHHRRGKLHPAAQVFQALRIAVNRELERVAEWLEKTPRFLSPGCRLLFLTFHSLEDRIVKQGMLQLQDAGRAFIIKPFPLKPGADEVRENPPSRSAKLRACELAA